MIRENWTNVRTEPVAGNAPARPGMHAGSGKATAQVADWHGEMLRIYARNQLRLALFMPILVVLFALANLAWVPFMPVMAWLVACLVLEGCRLLLVRRYIAQQSAATREWLHTFTITELLYAALWMVPVLIFWQPGAILQHVFIGASVMAGLAVRLLITGNFVTPVVTGNGLVLLALSLRAAGEGDIPDLAMAVMVLTLGLFFIQIGRRLHHNMKELLEHQRRHERLIRELRHQRDVAEHARKQAEEANHAKSQFLATVSHELRTPLNAIMGLSEIISTEMLGPVAVRRYREYAHDIHRSGSYLLHLVEDILDLSRIEAGRMEMKEEVVDVVAEAKNAINLLFMQAEARHQKLLLQTAPDVELLGHARCIRQIWVNLLSNAIKFTPAGGRIVLSVRRREGGDLVLEVRDTGEGIPAHELNAVTRSFTRGAAATRRAVDGAGLGLTIVNGLARLHDARLELESEEGRGTTARVVFPARRVIAGVRAPLLRAETAADSLEHQLLLLTA